MRRRRWYRWLAVVPTLGMLGGVPFANRVRPYVFGLPFLLAWIVIWVVMTSLTMALIFALDTAHSAHVADADAADAADAVTTSLDQSTST